MSLFLRLPPSVGQLAPAPLPWTYYHRVGLPNTSQKPTSAVVNRWKVDFGAESLESVHEFIFRLVYADSRSDLTGDRRTLKAPPQRPKHDPFTKVFFAHAGSRILLFQGDNR